jgi:hypothetical protein
MIGPKMMTKHTPMLLRLWFLNMYHTIKIVVLFLLL